MAGGWQRGAQEESCVVSSWMRVSMMLRLWDAEQHGRHQTLPLPLAYSSLFHEGVERAQVTVGSGIASRGEEKEKTGARRAPAEAQEIGRAHV